jgi:hypothetical protein
MNSKPTSGPNIENHVPPFLVSALSKPIKRLRHAKVVSSTPILGRTLSFEIVNLSVRGQGSMIQLGNKKQEKT